MMTRQRVLGIDPCEWLMSQDKGAFKTVCAIELGRDAIISSGGKLEKAFINHPEIRVEIILADLMAIPGLPDGVKSRVTEISLMLDSVNED